MNWDNDIKELEAFFAEAVLPKEIRLSAGVLITNVPLFVKSHLALVKNYNGKLNFLSVLERLKKVKQIIHEQTHKAA